MPKYIFGETMIELPDDPVQVAQIIEDLDIEDYHDLGDFRKHGDNTILSKSQLALMDCPAKFEYEFITPKDPDAEEDDEDHLNIGNAVHTLALEPDLFHDRFYVLPEGLRRDKRTKDYQAAIAEAKDRKMIVAKGNKSAAGFDDIKGMAKALTSNRKALALLEGAGKIEPSIFWDDPDTGVRLRARPDFLRDDGLIVDLKTGHTADPMLFSKVAYDLHYDISVAMTTEAVTRLRGKRPDNYVFLMIESKPPYVIEAYDSFRPWDPNDMTKFTYFDAGSYRFRRALDRFVECRRSGIWPGYNTIVTPMSVPGYAMKKLEEGKQ